MERDNFPTFKRIGRAIAGWSARRRRLVDWVHGDWRARGRRLGIGLLVAFVVLAIPWTYFNITLGMKLEEELEQIQEAGEPVTPAQAAPEMPPEDANAAVIYNEVFRYDASEFGEYTGAEDPTPPLFEKIPQHIQTARERLLDADAPEAERIFREALDEEPLHTILERLRQASARRKCVFPVNRAAGAAARYPHLHQFRTAASYVAATILVEMRAGNGDAAFDWLDVGMRMSVHAAEEAKGTLLYVDRFMQNVLLSAARRGLRETTLPRRLHAHAPPTVGRDHVIALFADGLPAFRPLGEGLFRDLSGAEVYLSNLEYDYWDSYTSLPALPVRKADHVQFHRLWRWVLENDTRLYRELVARYPGSREAAYWGPESPPRWMWQVTPLSLTLVPRLGIETSRRDSAITELESFAVAVALNLYRQEHGEYPRTLEPLAGTVDWPIPDDIFSGEPFGYRREGDGYVLWSVGPDLDDDGGVSADEAGASWFEDSDIVWRAEG